MHVLLVGPASSGQLYPQAARRLGMRVTVITTGRDVYALPDDVREFIDDIRFVGTLSAAELRATSRQVHRERPVHAVVAGDEFTVPATATIAADLGVDGIDPADAQVVRDKSAMRARLHAAGVRAPAFVVASSPAEAADAGETVGFPCVIKPSGMVGTIGVRRADSREDLIDGYRRIADETLPVAGRLPDSTVVVEQYLRGQEFSAEGYVRQGQATILAITEKCLGPEPYFQQQGHIVRPAQDVPGHEAVADHLEQVTKALGLTTGAFHAEYRVTDEGPTLIEIGARMAGDHIAEMVETVTGLSLAQASLAAAAGVPCPAPATPAAAVAGIHFVTEPRLAGRSHTGLRGWEEALRLPGVHDARIAIPAGRPIPDRQDMRSRIGHLMFTAATYDDAVRLRRTLADRISVVG
ncbi:ATP-grasp domain-containing protein [Actinoallomurus liliacearum]|uniref:ATP-grasp domain-containing protein n=1 Tax=Actinoallomurus liliacearum TaxID=1080073 RepID=A0ABP8TNV3_9ACTN